MAAIVLENVKTIFSKSPTPIRRLLIQKCLGETRVVTSTGCSVRCQTYSSGSPPTLQKAGEATQLARHDPEAESLSHEDYFDVKSLVNLKDLFSARVHLGHKEGLRHEYMAPYIFGTRQGIDIIDLDQTLPLLHDALNFTAHMAYRGGIILFLSRNNQMMPVIEKTASECGEYSHCRFWKAGTFANAAVQFQAETRLPDLCIFINTLNNAFGQHRAVTETAKVLVPAVGIVDTNCDPRLITYPVPGNDDSPTAIKLYCKLFKEAILQGKAKRKEDGLDEQ